MAAENTYVVHVLAFLAELQTQAQDEHVEHADSVEILAELTRRANLDAAPAFSIPKLPDLQSTLDALAALGIVEKWEQEERAESSSRWRISGSIKPMCTSEGNIALTENLAPFSLASNRNSPPPKSPQSVSGDGEFPQGGRGLAEVLAHPVLFCLSDADFDELLELHLVSDPPLR